VGMEPRLYIRLVRVGQEPDVAPFDQNHGNPPSLGV
jgi:hypothetical protein